MTAQEPVKCPVCGQVECDREHPEVAAWSDGIRAIEEVLQQLEERKTAETETKKAA